MARLPHRVDIKGPSNQLRSAYEWCHAQWPFTHQATWHGRINLGWGDEPAEGSWWFQREEDAMLFRLAWCWR